MAALSGVRLRLEIGVARMLNQIGPGVARSKNEAERADSQSPRHSPIGGRDLPKPSAVSGRWASSRSGIATTRSHCRLLRTSFAAISLIDPFLPGALEGMRYLRSGNARLPRWGSP